MTAATETDKAVFKGCGLVLGVVVALLVLLAVLNWSGSGDEKPVTPTTTAGKYQQTWTKSYAATTCADWTGPMTAQQRRVAAADILTSARNKINGGSGLPPNSLIDDFRDEISTACTGGVGTLTITDASYYIYNFSTKYKP